MAKVYLKTILFCFFLILCGCENVAAVYHITLGNFYFFNDRLQEADYQYSQAMSNEAYRDIAVYNRGTVYFHLGEARAAMEVWDQFQSRNRKTLDYRYYYNRALLKYESGDYQGAFLDLKQALIINPDGQSAKICMESVLERLAPAVNKETIRQTQTHREDRSLSDASRRIFDYIKRNEVFEWDAQNMQKPESDLRDW